MYAAAFAVGMFGVVATSSGQSSGEFSPSTWDVIFNDVAVGSTSAAQTVTVSNRGGGPLPIVRLAMVGPHENDFLVSNDTCTGQTLAAGGSCQVGLRYRPTENGTRVAHLRFDLNEGCSEYITLAGGGSKEPTARAAACERTVTQTSTTTVTTPGATTPGTNTSSVSASELSRSSLGLPRTCTSRRQFTVRLNPPKGMRFTEVTAKVGKKTMKVVRGDDVTATVDLRGLPRGRFTLTVRARTAGGRVLERKRRYVTCVKDKTVR